jgi:hypothetical protein
MDNEIPKIGEIWKLRPNLPNTIFYSTLPQIFKIKKIYFFNGKPIMSNEWWMDLIDLRSNHVKLLDLDEDELNDVLQKVEWGQ